MFLSSHQVVIDPVDLKPMLIVYASSYRPARGYLRRHDNKYKIIKASKTTSYGGLQVWKLFVKFSDPDRAQEFISAFPKKTWTDSLNQPVYC